MEDLEIMSENSFKKIDVGGLQITPIQKSELLEQLTKRIANKEKTFVVTPYSEFLYSSLRRPEIRNLLNSSDYAIADGVAILWARYFLSIPLTLKNFYLNIIQAWWQVVWTGASILLRPSLLYKEIPEKIVGADLVWDLASLAEKNNFTLYLLGGLGDVPKKTSEKLLAKYPNLKIVGTSNKDMHDPSIIDDIVMSKPDMLFVAFKAQEAEDWIANHLGDLPISFAIALGGTFDYITGAKKQPPKFIRGIGLEWLYRLLTQPSRLKRIFNATFGLVLGLVRHKVFSSMSYRQSVVAIVRNSEGKVLAVQRNPHDPYLVATGNEGKEYKFANYWQFVRGGAEIGEALEETGRRELREEMNIKNVEFIKASDKKITYDWTNALRPLINNIYHHRGQEQSILYYDFKGQDEEIKPDGKELVNYKWVDLSDLHNVIYKENMDLVELVKSDLQVEKPH